MTAHQDLAKILKPMEHIDSWDYTISSYDGDSEALAAWIIKELEVLGYLIVRER